MAVAVLFRNTIKNFISRSATVPGFHECMQGARGRTYYYYIILYIFYISCTSDGMFYYSAGGVELTALK